MDIGDGELVGRRGELRLVSDALEHLGTGPASVFQVVGEPGIGKSTLLGEAAAWAAERGFVVLDGRAAEFEQDVPFDVFVDALDPYLATLAPSFLGGIDEDRRAELAAIFPALGEIAAPEARPALQEERYRAHYAVRGLIELIAKRGPCLLVLDDMHWADQASIELLAHLLRRRPHGRALILLAYRPSQAPRALQAALDQAEREGDCERVELTPLARSEADRLLERVPDPALRERLFDESGGNPFYLEQLARAAGRGVVPGADPDRVDVPSAVVGLIEDEVGALGQRERRLLEGAAIAGDPFRHELAASAADLPESDALESLDLLVDADLVRPSADGEFRFRHPIVRAAVYESAPPGWSVGAHSRVAQSLLRRGAPPQQVAGHVERSARSGDRDSAMLLVQAAELAGPRAPATAARWLRSALDLLPADAAAEERVKILVPLARALGYSGRLEESRTALHEVLALLPAELGSVRGQVAAFLSLIEHLLGRHGEARETLRRVLDGLPPESSADRAALEVELSADCFFLRQWEEMGDWAEPALERAREGGDPLVHAAAASLLGLSRYEMLRIDEAREYADEAARLLDDLTEDQLAQRVHACLYLGWVEYKIDEFDRAVRHLERGISVSRAYGQGHMIALMTIGIAIVDSWRGRLDSASIHAEEAVEMAHLAGSDQLMAWAQTARCFSAGRRGDLEDAIDAGTKAVDLGGQVPVGPYTVGARFLLAGALIDSGEAALGREQLTAIEDTDLSFVEPSLRSGICEVMARAELALGRIPEAREWAGRALEAVTGRGMPGHESIALRAEAAVALAGGDAPRAAELAMDAAERGGSAYRVDAARARLLAGRAFAECGKGDRAIEELERARSELEECGARRYRDQATRELRKLGVRIGRGGTRGTSDTGVDSLSGRESEVAHLVADRLTNREIAERLSLSEKTIERHMSRIFQKLEVASRVEVAEAVESDG